MEKIRVGIIRCDLHAIYYANVLQEHDPYVLREPEYGRGGYYYFYSHYNDPKKMAFPIVEGFELVKVWDADRRRAENMTKIYLSRPKVCETFEEVSDEVDLVLIADCNGDGSDHLKLAKPGIEKGVPTFIDKPLAYDMKDALALVELALKHDTPIMSLSILRELPHAIHFRNRFVELNGAKFGVIKGSTQHMAGFIHAISLAQHLFGAGVESVEAMGGNGKPFIMHLDYGGKIDRPIAGVMLNCDAGPTFHCALYASAYSELGAVHSSHFSDYEFPWGVVRIVKKIKRMVETRQPQAPYEEMLEGIAIAVAARLSLVQRRRVFLSEVWDNAPLGRARS
jgi:predicted dehydrogenase